MSEPAIHTERQKFSSTHANSLSVVVLTLNEEHTLARCLERLDFATEIIVADTGSTDGTLQVAQRFTRHVIQVAWQGFGPTKQAALEHARGTWILSLDADEVLDDRLQAAIRAVVETDAPEYSGYRVNRRSNFLGTWMNHSGWYPDWIVRLARRDAMRFSQHTVHEHIEVRGRVGRLEGHLLHYTDPDWAHYMAKLAKYSRLSAQALHQKGRRARLFDLVLRPPYQFLRTYVFQAGFLDGRAGFALACGSAFHVFSKYAHLWTLGRERSDVHTGG